MFPGFLMANASQNAPGQERTFDSGSVVPTQIYHLLGDTRLNSGPSSGGNAMWTNVSAGSVTLTSAVVAGDATAHVSSCPPPFVPGQILIVDYSATPVELFISGYTSCSGTTLTFNAPAANAAANGHFLAFLQWRPAAQIAQDEGQEHFRETPEPMLLR